MIYRFRALIAVLAIALQASDSLVLALGHSHADQSAYRQPAAASQHRHCCQHEACAGEQSESPLPGESPADHHDDCPLCRHFSQPVAPVAFIAPLAASQRVEAFVPPHAARVISLVAIEHPARGPPAAGV